MFVYYFFLLLVSFLYGTFTALTLMLHYQYILSFHNSFSHKLVARREYRIARIWNYWKICNFYSVMADLTECEFQITSVRGFCSRWNLLIAAVLCCAEEAVVVIIYLFRSTLQSRSNKACLKCPSIRPQKVPLISMKFCM